MSRHDEELPTLDLSTLEQVTGGAGAMDSMSTMLPMMMMMRNRQAAAAPVAPPQPVMPKILLNGVEQPAAAPGTAPGANVVI